MISKLRFGAIACDFASVPSDSDEQSCFRSALTLIFNLLAPLIFERCGTSAVAELVRGSWSNLPTYIYIYIYINSYFKNIFSYSGVLIITTLIFTNIEMLSLNSRTCNMWLVEHPKICIHI